MSYIANVQWSCLVSRNLNVHCLQEYSTNLGQVVDIVVSHQGLPLKVSLVAQLMAALVLPAPEHYRPLLRRFAALGEF